MSKLPRKLLKLQFPNPNETTVSPIDISLYVDMNVGIGGDIWPAAQLFCNLLTYSKEYFQHWQQIFNDKRVLELGSGNGLISILLEKLYPSTRMIAASDIEDHLDLIGENLQLNHCNAEKVKAEDVNWFNYVKDGVEVPSELKYDVILALEW